jgi:hypothetical protein
MAKYKIEQLNIGDEITYKNIYMKNGYSTGIVIAKADHELLSVENTDRDPSVQKFVEMSEVLTINKK